MLVIEILSDFGIKLDEVEIKTIILNNGTNLGKKNNKENSFKKIVNVRLKALSSTVRVSAEACKFVPLLFLCICA